MRTKSIPPPLSKNTQILTTVILLFGNITFACALNFFSPSLEELRIKYDTTVDDISKVFSIALTSCCIGALTGGFIFNWINRQLGVIICVGGMAAFLLISPHCPNQTVFFIVVGLLGFCAGVYDTAQVVWMIEMWQSKAGPFIQAQHLCYALGSNIPPLITAPFLSRKSGGGDDMITFDDPLSTDLNNSTELSPVLNETLYESESRIYMPFTIAAGLNALNFGAQIILFIFFRYHKPPSEEELRRSGPYRDTEYKSVSQAEPFRLDSKSDLGVEEKTFIKWPRIRLIALAALFLGAYQGMEMCTMQFTPTFATYSDMKLSSSDSALVLSSVTGTFAFGRFLGVFIILKVSPLIMLCGNLVLILIGNLILLVWGSSNLTMLWVGCITIGLGFSTIYASYCAFIEKYLTFTDAVGAAFIVCGSTIASIYPLIVGGLIEKKVVVLTFVNFFSIFVCSIVLAVAFVVTKNNRARL